MALVARNSPSTFRPFSSQLIHEANFNPEEIIDECGNIRASIQTLNDVRMSPLVFWSSLFLSHSYHAFIFVCLEI